MNVLDYDYYLMLLRIIPSKKVGTLLAAPPCTEYSLLKLKQPGPLPCRSPDCMDVPLFNAENCHFRFFSSREILSRTVTALELNHTHGGYSLLEQPLNAMSWDEPFVKEAPRNFLTESAIISHCRTLDAGESPLNKRNLSAIYTLSAWQSFNVHVTTNIQVLLDLLNLMERFHLI